MICRLLSTVLLQRLIYFVHLNTVPILSCIQRRNLSAGTALLSAGVSSTAGTSIWITVKFRELLDRMKGNTGVLMVNILVPQHISQTHVLRRCVVYVFDCR